MSTIPQVLTALKNIVLTLDVTPSLSTRVWTHPGQASSISFKTYPFAIVSKVNSQVGSWTAHSYGTGQHKWNALVAIYVAPGPVIVTNNDKITVDALTYADQYYDKMSTLLYNNMTLSGTVDYIGDGDGKLFDYVTDNIIWNAQQHYGHLFLIDICQTVSQSVNN
jgi:hypothetical protein